MRLFDILAEVAILLQPAAFRIAPEPQNFRPYRAYDLSFDLYNLRLGEKPADLRVITATRAVTDKKTGSLWVPLAEDVDQGEHLSELQFLEVVK